MKPTNTVFSTNSKLHIKELLEAKMLLIEEFGSKYSIPDAHLGYCIVPLPEYNFDIAKKDLLEYVSKQKPFKVRLSELIIDPRNHFCYVKVEGEQIKKHHENLTNLLNKHRDGHVREKDLERLNNGDFNDQKKQYLEEYGYARVMDLFKSHITIGNCDMDTDIEVLEKRLLEILSPVLNKEMEIKDIHAIFHTDSRNRQDEMKVIWEDFLELQ